MNMEGKFNQISGNNSEQEEFLVEIAGLSDEEFANRYPEDGFGWAGDKERDSVIRERINKLKESRPDLYLSSFTKKTSYEPEEVSSQRDISHKERKFLKNNEEQLVGENKEPLRRGSPEWQEAARKNSLPLNQEKERN